MKTIRSPDRQVNPQPQNITNLSRFPKVIVGSFAMESRLFHSNLFSSFVYWKCIAPKNQSGKRAADLLIFPLTSTENCAIMITQSKKGIDTMNCLKCPNYWKTDIDERKCDQCGVTYFPQEEKKEEQK